MGDKKESSSRILIRSHEGGFTKTFENPITCHDERFGDTKTPRSTQCYNLISTFLQALALRQFQVHPHIEKRSGHFQERIAASLGRQEEVSNVQEGSGKIYGKDTKADDKILDCE